MPRDSPNPGRGKNDQSRKVILQDTTKCFQGEMGQVLALSSLGDGSSLVARSPAV